MEETYLTIQHVSEYLSVKVSTIYSKIHEIPHYRIGRLVRFKKQDIDSWIESKKESGNTRSLKHTRPNKNKDTDINKIIRKAIDDAHT